MTNALSDTTACCRICDTPLGAPILDMAPPSITSISNVVPIPVRVYLCPECGHLPSPGLPDQTTYFDTEYQFSLDSEDHDQIYDIVDGKPVYRTAHQADLVATACPVPDGAKVLDYGAGKALTLKILMNRQPAIDGHVFDVSRDYVPNWSAWLPADRQSSYELPGYWAGTFDLVMSLLAFHCIPDPIRAFRDIARVLKPGGRFFMLVPDVLGNAADMIVAEHVNHFTMSSIERGLTRAGLRVDRIERGAFRGVFMVVAHLGDGPAPDAARSVKRSEDAGARAIAAFWSQSDAILQSATATLATTPTAIYGAGVYGTYIASRISKALPLRCFVDRNPHLIGTSHMGCPVVAPTALPADVEVIFAGLNPRIAAKAIKEFVAAAGRPDLRIVYLDDMPDVELPAFPPAVQRQPN